MTSQQKYKWCDVRYFWYPNSFHDHVNNSGNSVSIDLNLKPVRHSWLLPWKNQYHFPVKLEHSEDDRVKLFHISTSALSGGWDEKWQCKWKWQRPIETRFRVTRRSSDVTSCREVIFTVYVEWRSILCDIDVLDGSPSVHTTPWHCELKYLFVGWTYRGVWRMLYIEK